MKKKRRKKTDKKEKELSEKSRMELGCTIITVDIYSKVFAMNEGADTDQMCNNDCRE